jgi:alkylmercury lyase
VSTAAGLPRDEIEAATKQLRDAGALELDPQGRMVGAHGLTERRTDHTIVARERTWHTWCALDAIGIPVALGIDAEVHTRCRTCGSTVELTVRSGSTSEASDIVLWRPGGSCSKVMEDFCATANLFCSAEHLERWRADAGNPPGQVLTIYKAAEEGRHVWSDVAPPS